jgi:hypothetical protein
VMKEGAAVWRVWDMVKTNRTWRRPGVASVCKGITEGIYFLEGTTKGLAVAVKAKNFRAEKENSN